MVIRELYIKNFGKISECHFNFKEGIQVIEGENEAGKTTVHAFIRGMLFGMERGRGKAAAKDDFTRFEPWDDPGHYSGMMRFSCGGENFRLERDFARYTKRALLVCEDDGEELSVEQGDLSVLLGGLTPELFDSTVSIGQLKAAPGQALYAALENYAANYLETGGGDIDLDSTFRLLKEKKKDADRRIKEEEQLLNKERGRISQECTFLERDMEKLELEYRGLERRQKDLQEELKNETGAEAERIPGPGLAAWGGCGILAGCAGMIWSHYIAGYELLSQLPIRLLSGIIAAAGVLLVCAGLIVFVREKRAGADKRDCEKSFTSDSLKKLQWEAERIRREWKEKEICCGNLREQLEEISYSQMWEEYNQKSHALQIAIDELRNAAEETGKDVSSRIEGKASEIFSFLTSDKYVKLFFRNDGKIEVWDGGKRISAERLSRGTIEQIYFSLRIASAEILLDEEMPLIFDDAFVFYDEKRLESALKWLSGLKNQVIIFTCHKREKEIVEKEVIS